MNTVPQVTWAHVGTANPGGWLPAFRCRICGTPVLFVDMNRANPYQFMQMIIWAEEQALRCSDHLTSRRN